MLRQILQTIATRYLVAFLNLVLLFVNARTLGAERVGVIGLVVASANMVMVCNSVLCGNTIVYFMNRRPFMQVFVPAYAWSFLAGGAASLLLGLLGLIPAGYGWHVYALSLLFSLTAANARFLLGADRTAGFNLIYLLQGALLFGFVLFFYFILEIREVSAYLWGLYLANGVAWLASLFLLLDLFRRTSLQNLAAAWAEMFRYGLWAGVDNLAEQFTSRLNYFLVKNLCGLGSVGLLDAGTKVSESIWNISRSVAIIAYGNVARTDELSIQRQITLQLTKLTFLATAVAMGAVAFIPEWVYTRWLFGPEFAGIRTVILCLAPGVVALACNSILSHFFIGSGRVRISAACSLLGLGALLLSGLPLISHLGAVGAAVSASVAFLSMFLFSLGMFCRTAGARPKDFRPTVADWLFLKEKGRKLLFRSRPS